MTRTTAPTKMRIGWKVMRIDPATGEAVSGADQRLRYRLEVGGRLAMPHPGLWLTLDRDYAIAHYAVHDYQVAIRLEFDESHVTRGALDDRETEIAVPSARILEIIALEGDD